MSAGLSNGDKKTLIVNLFGAAGSGKSTGAAYIFTKLKMDYIDAELVTEFAKDKTWERNSMVLSNQFYVFGKQAFRLARVAGQVDVVITDSPLLLSNYYAGNDPVMENFKKACVDVFNTYDNVNFFLNRVKPYNPNGRSQTENEANKISAELKQMLNGYNVPYEEVNGDETGYESIYQHIKTLLTQRGVEGKAN